MRWCFSYFRFLLRDLFSNLFGGTSGVFFIFLHGMLGTSCLLSLVFSSFCYRFDIVSVVAVGADGAGVRIPQVACKKEGGWKRRGEGT